MNVRVVCWVACRRYVQLTSHFPIRFLISLVHIHMRQGRIIPNLPTKHWRPPEVSNLLNGPPDCDSWLQIPALALYGRARGTGCPSLLASSSPPVIWRQCHLLGGQWSRSHEAIHCQHWSRTSSAKHRIGTQSPKEAAFYYLHLIDKKTKAQHG